LRFQKGASLFEFGEESRHEKHEQTRFILFSLTLEPRRFTISCLWLYLWNFSEFKDLLRSYHLSNLAKHQEDYAHKSSMLGRVAAERLIEQEKVNTQLSQETKELKRNFSLAQAANIDLEKKVAELAEALKQCQDSKRIAEEALEQSNRDLEKLQKTHDDDLSLIENLHRNHDKSSKIAEDLCANNADLAKSLSS
jgi:chromosome segregation ATPase